MALHADGVHAFQGKRGLVICFITPDMAEVLLGWHMQHCHNYGDCQELPLLYEVGNGTTVRVTIITDVVCSEDAPHLVFRCLITL